jgi:ribosomal protein S18 acetylase RimI-like enzyme
MLDHLSIRALTQADAGAYNAFFERGVQAHPDTLRIAPEDFATAPFSTTPTADALTLAAVRDDGTWLGVVTVEREGGRAKRRHVAWILRMYVAAEHVGKGVGRALLRTALERAAVIPGVAKVNLTVAAHNDAAVALYRSEGFEPFAREEDAFRDPHPRAELSMSARVR